MISSVERELLQSIDFTVAEEEYIERQDYLAALIRELTKLSDEAFNGLSNDAAAWCNDASIAHRLKKPINDFDGEMTIEPVRDDDQETEPETETKKKKSHRKLGPPKAIKGLTGEIDVYGIAVGSKNHRAAAMLSRPEGASMKEVASALGKTFYNLKRRLVSHGHTVIEEKVPDRGVVFKLTPKSD